jgi:hypothetical protein
VRVSSRLLLLLLLLLFFTVSLLVRHTTGGSDKYACAWLCDLLQLAEQTSATSFRVLLDAREHNCESLLHTSLAQAQGPAFVCVLEGTTLDKSALAAALNATTAAGKLAISGFGFPRPGKGLISLFHVTDCLQVQCTISMHVICRCIL